MRALGIVDTKVLLDQGIDVGVEVAEVLIIRSAFLVYAKVFVAKGEEVGFVGLAEFFPLILRPNRRRLRNIILVR